MKNNKNGRKKGKYILFAVAMALFGGLLAISLYLNIGKKPIVPVKSEIVVLLVVLMAILPLLLLALGIAILAKRNSNTEADIRINMVGVANGGLTPVEVAEEEDSDAVSEETPSIPSAPSVAPVAVTPARTGNKKKEDEKEKDNGIRFPELCRLDERKKEFVRETYDEDISLREFCEEFRNYAAGKLKLYYDIKDIRQFVAGMAVSKIIILQGMSGTGKTSLAYAFGEFVQNGSMVISVQPMWKERTDLIGYFNEFTKKFSEMPLLKKMYEANYSEDMYVTVLDEMNIARVEYYFAEFLSLLELPDVEKRLLPVVTTRWKKDPERLTGGYVKLPKNMWYVGTANNDDSTFAISDKVYDRAMVMDLDKKAEPFTVNEVRNIHIRSERFYELAEAAQKEYKLMRRNRSRLKLLDEYMIEKFHITFGNRIMKQINTYIPVYVSCGGKELDALDEILSKKVMRKLGMQNPVHVRNSAADFIKYIDDLFGEENMLMCKESIERIARNA